jgi:uncharacterized protein (DUF924 family)
VTRADDAAPDPRIEAVLAFWFDVPGGPEEGVSRKAWFRKDPAFDDAIRTRFGASVEEAMAGGLADWPDTERGALALLVVCDQFPRNLFRGEARAFALDPRALALARDLVARGLDRRLTPVRRLFVYLPFEHSESLADQREAVRLIRELEAHPETVGLAEWAEKHLAVIERFGRFPHRNAALGRASTAQEAAYLAQPGSGF